MSKLTKVIILIVIIGGVAAVGIHFYSLSRVAGKKREAYNSLERLHMVRGATTITPSLVRDRVEKRMKKIGVRVSRDAINVRLEPVSRDNLDELPKTDQAAFGIAGKLKNHEVKMWLLQVGVPVVLSYGWVTERARIQRTFTIKGAVNLDPEEEFDEGEFRE